MAAIGVGSAITFIVTWLKGSSLTKSLIMVALFLALKALLITLITVTLAIVFHNFILDFVLEWVQGVVSGLPDSGLSATVYQMTGVAGWFGSLLKIPECTSVIISSACVIGIRRFIPFL
jgi:hypothetical protein